MQFLGMLKHQFENISQEVVTFRFDHSRLDLSRFCLPDILAPTIQTHRYILSIENEGVE